jgi:hypothetical protein
MYGKQVSLRQVYRQVLRYFDFPLPEAFHQCSILYSRSFIFDVSRLCKYVVLSVNLTQKERSKYTVKGSTRNQALIPVAEQSNARVCDRSLAGITGSNLAGGMAGCLF